MLTVVTGATGFVGRAVVREMAVRGWPGDVRLVDRAAADSPAHFEAVRCDVTDTAVMREALRGTSHVLHLAALPGGASEADPAESRAVNLEATLNLIDTLAGTGARLVYASSIAVLGNGLSTPVDDATPPSPRSTYGAHKAMCEVALADAVRRGSLDAVALRLPGIVARPRSAGGFGSAFLSDLFHGLRDGGAVRVPVGTTARTWLLSARQCARNLLAALAAKGGPAVAIMPALHVEIGSLAAEIGRQCAAEGGVLFEPDPATEAVFGAYPPLATALAERIGLVHDGSLPALVQTALEDLGQ